jgi:hypothetical protein
MDNPIILVVVGIFFGGAVGLLLGLGLVFLRRRSKDKKLQAVDPEPISNSTPPPPLPVPLRNSPKDSVEILSVWRNERTGKLLAFLETKPISPSYLTSEHKDKISQILAGLHSMIGDVAPPVSPPQATPTTSASPSLTEQTTLPASPLGIAPLESPPTPQMVEPGLDSEEPPPAGQPQKVYFADTLPEPVSLRQALTGNPFKINVPSTIQKSVTAPKSIVEQIDEILQTKLVDSPFSDREIRLKEAPNGMTVLIGSYKYEGIDAVPDPAIRALIKEAAREWNEKVSRRR